MNNKKWWTEERKEQIKEKVRFEIADTAFQILDLFKLILGLPYAVVFGHRITDTDEMIAEQKRAERIKDGLTPEPIPSKYLVVRLLAGAWEGITTTWKWFVVATIYILIAEIVLYYAFHIPTERLVLFNHYI